MCNTKYVVAVVVQFFLYPVLSPNNGGSRIYLILLATVLTLNVHLEHYFHSDQLFLSVLQLLLDRFSLVYPFSPKMEYPSQKVVLILSQYMFIPTDTISFCQLIYCFIQVLNLH